MSTVGISFGSATSGTGFDVASTVSSIMAVERTPETAWATRTTALTAQDMVLSSLGTNASALSTSLASLTGFDGVFAQKTGATSDTTAVVLTNVASNADVESHTLTVQALAQTSKDRFNTVASGTTLSGTLKLTVGSGTQSSVSISAGSTVSQVAAQINGASLGVTASVISDSNGSRLLLTSGISGTAGELSIDSSGVTDSTNAAYTSTEVQAGVDAAYTLDGASLTSGSNTVSTALNGVTFQLVGTTSTAASGNTPATTGTSSSTSVTLQIAADTSSVSTALSTFVSAYNTLARALTAQEGKDASGNAEPLFGSPVIQQLQSGLSAALNFTTGTYSTTSGATQPVSLATLGITTGTDGTLSLDTSTLSSALSSRLSDVTTFFQASGYFGQNLTTTLTNLGSTGSGVLGLATTNNSSEETTLANNKTALEARLSVYQTNLTTELTTANEILQSIPSQLKGITALFNAITGYTGG